MDIQIVEKGNVFLVLLKGSLDMYSSLELKNRTDKIPVSNQTEIIIDFAHINFVDSSGIGTLIKIFHQIKEAGGKLYLTNLKPPIEKVFKVAGLMNLFPILPEDEYKTRYSPNS